MSYQPIGNYGIIGDLNTIALVGTDGSIDFMCFPHFDSPTIFAKLLDDKKGGSFSITPEFADMKCRQMYLPDTNVLLTRFLSTEGVGEIIDLMPVEGLFGGMELIRRVITVRGEVQYKMNCSPRFNYALAGHTAELINEKEAIFECKGKNKLRLRLKSSVPLTTKDGDIFASFTLKAGEKAEFLLEDAAKEHWDIDANNNFEEFVTDNIFRTVNYWRDWVAQSEYKGRWQHVVNRSALVLKLLTSYKYGAIIAAPTFGLPEKIEGKRNWDYRYTWIRDGSLSMYPLLRLGYKREVAAFMGWIEKLCEDMKGHKQLGIMYAIDGKRQLKEHELKHFEGYMKSSPVRVGNDAYEQLQLDIYGELMNAVYLFNKYGESISYGFWTDLEKQLDWLADNWKQPDEGIWEVRGGKQQFLYSRLQCWVAFDRAIKVANTRSYPVNSNWEKQKDKIFKSIYKDFWDEKRQAFMQYPGSETVDASAMMMPLVGFISPKDPKWLSTLKRIEDELVSDSLVYRYRPEVAAPDGLAGQEGTFSLCTFWYVECLCRSGQVEKARFFFEKMLGYANHLGLYSEQLGFQGDQLGNYPQAFTHLALISAATILDKELNDPKNRSIHKYLWKR